MASGALCGRQGAPVEVGDAAKLGAPVDDLDRLGQALPVDAGAQRRVRSATCCQAAAKVRGSATPGQPYGRPVEVGVLGVHQAVEEHAGTWRGVSGRTLLDVPAGAYEPVQLVLWSRPARGEVGGGTAARVGAGAVRHDVPEWR